MHYWRPATLAILLLASAVFGKKKNPDDVTQTLDLPKDPPMVTVGETSHLIFHVSLLSPKGLLSQQTRDALKALLKANGNIPVVHIRAFVAGSGDLRRVPQIVSDVFREKKLDLPSVSVVQAGALPLENAQVVLETVSVAKKDVNTAGLAYVEAQTAPSLQKSLDLVAARLGSASALRVTCFVSAIDGTGTGKISARFPAAAVNLVQTQRESAKTEVSCEAVGRGGNIRAPKLAFSGTRVAFGADEKAAALAFQRLDKDLADAGVVPADILATTIYPLSARAGDLARKVRTTGAPVTAIPVEGIASVEGAFAVDAIAAVK
jgi:enamine deaminase RidA (YjgF/YER057c/UK114 family)